MRVVCFIFVLLKQRESHDSRVLKTGYTKTGYMRSSWDCITAVSTRSLGPQKLKINCFGRMFCHLCQTFTFLMTFTKKGRHKDQSLNACAGYISIPIAPNAFQWTPIHSNGPQTIPTAPSSFQWPPMFMLILGSQPELIYPVLVYPVLGFLKG